MMLKQFLYFTSNDDRHLLPVADVVEVVPMLDLKRDTNNKKDKNFCGVFNFRGEIVPVFCLENVKTSWLENPAYFLVICQAEQGLVAVLATQVDEIIQVDESAVKTLQSSAGLALTMVKQADDMLEVLNPNRLML